MPYNMADFLCQLPSCEEGELKMEVQPQEDANNAVVMRPENFLDLYQWTLVFALPDS